MTKDYEADNIAYETRRHVEAEVKRRMQSPYTRAEFVAREVEAGIEAQGAQGVDVEFCDLDPDAATAIRQRAEWNAQAAERAGITWQNEAAATAPEPVPTAVRRFEDRVAAAEESIEQCHDRVHRHDARITALERRENLHVQAIGELSARLSNLEKDLCELSTRIGVLEQQIDPSPLIADHDRRLSLQLERITALANSLSSLQQTVKVIRERLYENVTDDADCGLLEQVRRLDADMALVRDAVCPPPGSAGRADDGAHSGAHPADVLADSLSGRSPIFDPVHGIALLMDSVKSGPVVYSQKDRDLLVERLGQYAEHLRQTRDALRAACLELGADATWSDDTNLADVVSKMLMPAVRGRIASEGLAERAGIVKWLRLIGEYVGPGDVTHTAYRRSADRIEAGVHWKDLNQV